MAPTSPVVHRGSTYSSRSVADLSKQTSRTTRSVDYTARPGAYTFSRNTAIATPVGTLVEKAKLALLLPGHNEELIIAHTIRSAISAGQPIDDIYVVDDNSNDKTREIAVGLLGESNVLSVERSGKAMAVQKAIKHFHIVDRYEWLHVADADSLFCADYFRIYRANLIDDYVVALGFVQSLKGNWISTYRAICYTYGQHVFRRVQSALGMVSVFPGPVTSFRTDILKELDINSDHLTEDFDFTLQVHRKKLGKIKFIPKAINYTQDPQSFSDFSKQSMRWYRGFFQGITEYRIGLHRQAIDIGLGVQIAQIALLIAQVGLLFPYILYKTHHWMIISIAIATDFIINSAIVMMSSVLAKRWNMLGVLPYFYFLRTAEIIMFLTAFIEVVILKKFRKGITGWATEGRRYKINAAALQEATA